MDGGSNRSGERLIARPLAYTRDERDRDRREWDALLDADAVKTPTLTHEQICKQRAKKRAAEFIELCELSNYEVARIVGRDESCVRAWLDLRRFDRDVPAWIFDALIDALGEQAFVAWRMVRARWIREEYCISKTG